MKHWSSLPTSSWATPWARRLWLLGALCLGALLMTLYVQVLHSGIARADQLRLGQRSTTNTLALGTTQAPRRPGPTRR